jgi:hypothetical protein
LNTCLSSYYTYNTNTSMSRIVVIEDELTITFENKLSSSSSSSSSRNNKETKEMKRLRIELAEHKRRIEELEEQNDNLLLELASLKMNMSASSAKSGFDGRGGGGGENNNINHHATSIPVLTNDMSASSGFDGGGSDSSLCVVAANDSFSNSNDLIMDEQTEEVISNGDDATTPVRHNMSSSLTLDLQPEEVISNGGGNNSNATIPIRHNMSSSLTLDLQPEEVVSNGGGNNSNATIPIRHHMSSSSGFDFGESEGSLCFFAEDDGSTTNSSSSIDVSAYGRQAQMMASASSGISRRNSTTANIIPRCSSHGARRASIGVTAQNSQIVSNNSCTSMNSSTSIDFVTDYGYGDTTGGVVPTNTNTTTATAADGSSRRDMMAASSSSISRRSLFRRNSEIITSPKCSPHVSRRVTIIGVLTPHAAMPLHSNSTNTHSTAMNSAMNSCSSVDYGYGDTEDVGPTTGITTPNGREDMNSTVCSRRATINLPNSAPARHASIGGTDIGRRATVGGNTSQDNSAHSSTSSGTRGIPRRRISAASTDLLRIYNGFISLDDMTTDDLTSPSILAAGQPNSKW